MHTVCLKRRLSKNDRTYWQYFVVTVETTFAFSNKEYNCKLDERYNDY